MVVYGLLFGGAAAAALAKSLIYATVLGPDEFGLISLSLLVTALGSYLATFGIQDSLVREAPILRGRKKSIAVLRGTALTSVFIGSSLVGLLVAVICATLYRSHLPDGAWLIGPYLTASVMFNISQVDLQVREHSEIQAGFLMGRNLAPMLVILLTGTHWTAVEVLSLETVLLVAICCASLVLKSEENSWALEYAEMRRLVGKGLPYMSSSIVQNLTFNMDRWAVQLVFGVAALGTYTFAMQAVSAGLVLVNLLQMYFTPRWIRLWAENGDNEDLWKRAVNALAVVGVASAIGAVVGNMLAPEIVRSLWPEYEQAIPLLPWVVVGAMAVSLGFFEVFYFAFDAGIQLLRIQLLVIGGLTTLLALIIYLDAPIEAFAVAFSIARVCSLLLGWINARKFLIVAN